MVLRSFAVAIAFCASSAAPLASQDSTTSRPRAWLGFLVDSGVRLVVREVAPRSPAMRAGLLTGDTIVTIDGRAARWSELTTRIGRATTGDTIRIGVHRARGHRDSVAIVVGPSGRRGAGTLNAQVTRLTLDSAGRVLRNYVDTLRTRAGDPRLFFEGADSAIVFRDAERGVRIPIDSLLRLAEKNSGHATGRDSTASASYAIQVGTRAIAGAELSELDPRLASYLGARDGLLVLRVSAVGPASRSGILAGDVITRANGVAVQTVAALRRIVQTERDVKLSIVRNRVSMDIALKP
jgi:S1-C subfamily serine protease